MKTQRVALIYDNRPRPETTGFYCHRALRELVQVTHFLPDQVDRIPKRGFDLYLNIDDGLDYRLPPDLRPSVWWVIDTHLNPEFAADKGRDFDWLFAAQRDGAERLRELGLPAQWLPLACDPQLHKPHPVAKRWDVCFIGWVYPGVRQEAIALIQQHFPNSFVGRAYFDDYARTCSESRVGFNRSVANDVNMRVFETLACGMLLLTNDLRENGQEELLNSDKHFVSYVGAEEMLDKLRFYVRNNEARERIAQAGYAEVITRHTYRHRMQTILETIPAGTPSVGRPSQASRADCDAKRISTTALVEQCCSPASKNPQIVRPISDDCGTTSCLDSIDIIIKTFLRPQALLRLLNSILEFYPQVPVTIADDGDLRDVADADSRACRQLIDSTDTFTLHSMPFAAGVTPGRNLLVDKTHRPFLLLLDDDFCFTPETRIERFWYRLQSDPDIGVVAGACIDIIGTERRPRNSGGTMRIEGDALIVNTTAWTDRQRVLRDYVPHFALIRREVFRDVRWEGGLGAEHYDFCLQLRKSRWRVAQDLSVRVDHYHFSEALAGYAEHRFNYADAQQWLLRKWNIRRIIQDGQVVVERHQISTSSALKDPPLPVGEGALNCVSPKCARLGDKDALYFDLPRPEVVALIPASARRVLDIGCGAGALGAAVKERQSAEVVGIELQPAAAAAARKRLDRVVEASVEDPTVDFPAGSFDCVVCADVLEHLRDPALVLEKIRRWLSPAGTLVASIPNVRHHSVVTSLMDGNWTYEAAGLLDNDHVRFFTRREIEKLLDRRGFEIAPMQAVSGPGDAALRAATEPGSVRVGSLNVSGLSPAAADEFFAYQYLIVARPAERPRRKLTSIIIVTHNQCAYTKECIDSVKLRTDEPYELIFVDNGSTDRTVDYLRGVAAHVAESLPDSAVAASPPMSSAGRPASGLQSADGGGRTPDRAPATDRRSQAALQTVQLIENPDNRGFPAAANQGLNIACGEFVLLLNNDTVVTTGWLRRLLDVLESDPRIGLVGPCSNCVSGRQMIPVSYQEIGSLDGFAWDWGKSHHGRIEDADRLIGFCLMVRRAVIDQIGLLDERFGIGCFEDDDLCRRALQAGWRAVIARDAFVHHYGHRTFQGAGIDLEKVLDTNRQKFIEKWCDPTEAEQFNRDPPGERDLGENCKAQTPNMQLALQVHPDGGLLLVAAGEAASACSPGTHPAGSAYPSMPASRLATNELSNPKSEIPIPKSRSRLSLCMIVRDNETTIGPALESVRPWVDEIIVVDTGSKDKTPEICQQYGAEIHEFAWCDDFSAARNESLKHARGEWIFWMDSDDTISRECGQKLRALADSGHQENILGYVMQVHCPGAGEEGQLDVTAVDHVKLIRNRPDLRFEGRIHEQLLPAIRRAQGEVAWSDIYVRHSGADHSPEGWQRKLDRDLRILNRELGDAPNHPFVLFNLGMTYADAARNPIFPSANALPPFIRGGQGRADESLPSVPDSLTQAIGYLERCLVMSTPDQSHLRKAYSLLVSSLSQAGHHEEAWQRCQEGLALFPDDKELLFRSAILHHHFGRLDEAERIYLRVLSEREDRHFSSIDRGLAGFKARHNLALVYDDMGKLDHAEHQWRLITQEVPNYVAAWRGLGDVLLRNNRIGSLDELVTGLLSHRCKLRREGLILQGKLAATRGDIAAASAHLHEANSTGQGDLEPLRALCRILFEQGEPEAAESALKELCARDPGDPAAYHNLGVMYIRRRNGQAAIQSLSRSLELRPDAPETQRQLQFALQI